MKDYTVIATHCDWKLAVNSVFVDESDNYEILKSLISGKYRWFEHTLHSSNYRNYSFNPCVI